MSWSLSSSTLKNDILMISYTYNVGIIYQTSLDGDEVLVVKSNDPTWKLVLYKKEIVAAQNPKAYIERAIKAKIDEVKMDNVRRTHIVSLREVSPVMPGVPTSNGSTVAALRCTCPEDYFCKHVHDTYKEAGDGSMWMPLARKEMNKNLRFYVAVPVKGGVFYPVRISKMDIKSWDEGEVSLLVADPGHNLHRVVIPSNDENASVKLCWKMFNTPNEDDLELVQAGWTIHRFVNEEEHRVSCKSKVLHKGMRSMILDWLKGDTVTLALQYERMWAASFILAKFGLCYPCYRDATALFSTMDLF